MPSTMKALRASLLAMALLSVAATAEQPHAAHNLAVGLGPRVRPDHLRARQDIGDAVSSLILGTGGSDSDSDQASSTEPPVSTPTSDAGDLTPTTSEPVETTPPPVESSTSIIVPPSTSSESQPTSTPQPSTSTPTSSAAPSTTTEKSSTTLFTSSTPTTQKLTTKDSTITQAYTTVVVTTEPNGAVRSSTRISTTLIPTSSAVPIDSTPDTSGGMSTSTRNTVIGVVCGVGGAIVLGGALFLWFKFHSRRKAREAMGDDDGLMMGEPLHSGMASPGEKSSGVSPGTSAGDPFRSTLESYHQPGKVNASANF